jgi:hypothetical protein
MAFQKRPNFLAQFRGPKPQLIYVVEITTPEGPTVISIAHGLKEWLRLGTEIPKLHPHAQVRLLMEDMTINS